MDKFLSSYYDKSGSLTRLQYLGRVLVLGLLVQILLLVPIVGMAAGAGSLYLFYFLVQQRLRSMGYNCSVQRTIFWQILTVIPIVGIVPVCMLVFTKPKEIK